MNHKYRSHKMTPENMEVNATLKEKCSSLDDFIMDAIPDSREKDIALAKLEECAMWATKALALHG